MWKLYYNVFGSIVFIGTMYSFLTTDTVQSWLTTVWFILGLLLTAHFITQTLIAYKKLLVVNKETTISKEAVKSIEHDWKDED
jgi:hypothetical protein